MMQLRQPWGPGVPISEARVWRHFYSRKFNAYLAVFASFAAIWHPHDGLAKASIAVQAVFWVTALPLFIIAYTLIHLSFIRFSLRFGVRTIWEPLVMFLTTASMIIPVLVVFPFLGIDPGGPRDLGELVIFCFALFEIGAFGYLAYADKALFPEVYASPADTDEDGPAREVFLRGTSLPVSRVEMIRSIDDGFEAYGLGQTFTARRRFGLVLSELPVDLGFQIHRSIWVSRDLAENWQRDGRNIYVTLSNGTRLPVARSRQREFENWLLLVAPLGPDGNAPQQTSRRRSA